MTTASSILFLMALAVISVNAATFTCPDASYSSFTNTYAQSSFGDTILIPSGSASWGNNVIISGRSVIGAGTNNTIITDETPTNTGGVYLIELSTTNSYLTMLSGIQFRGGVTNHTVSYNGDIYVIGDSYNWRICSNWFNGLNGKEVMTQSDGYGLIDHCLFTPGSDLNSLAIYGSGWGDVAWANPRWAGTSNMVYVEDCSFISPMSTQTNYGGWAPDLGEGGRVCYRHDTFEGYYLECHGSETGNRARSGRYIEVYNCNFSYGPTNNFYDLNWGVQFRGGDILFYSNSLTGFKYSAAAQDFRLTDNNDSSFYPWYSATGINPWDSNSPALWTGTASAGSTTSYLVSSGAGWTTNQWVGCTALDTNTGYMGYITTNDNQTLTTMPHQNGGQTVVFNSGDTVVIHYVYQAIDQPGVGQGALISGGTPTAFYPTQAVERCYFWSNTVTRVDSGPTSVSAAVSTGFPQLDTNIVNGIDSTYTPFVYPHTLQSVVTGQPLGTKRQIYIPFGRFGI